jgi:cell division protein FtsB
MNLRRVVRLYVFSIIFVLAVAHFFFGENGLVEHRLLKNQLDFEELKAARLNCRVDDLKNIVADWHDSDLPRERLAREELCMSFTNELICITPSQQK